MIPAGVGPWYALGMIPRLLIFAALLLAGCRASPPTTSIESGDPPTIRVIVLGMIHSGHRTSEIYSLDRLRQTIRRIDPDFVLTEIPPDRFDGANRQFHETGIITESRVSRFPEYTDVMFQLADELGFTIIPCAGWTKAMSDDRNEKLKRWETERPDDTAEVNRAQEQAEATMAEEGDPDDPMFIHTERYDELVEQALEPYNRLFNDDLGAGGWDNINAAHYALISSALDDIVGSASKDTTVVITFGAWHKYWIKRALASRDDIELLDPKPFFSE